MNDKLISINGYIIYVGIDHPRYTEITDALHNKPSAPEGFDYRLREDLSWEMYEVAEPTPEDDEITAEEALEIIRGGAE